MVRLGSGPVDFRLTKASLSAAPQMAIAFWGTRGSLPVSGPTYQRYGGSTMSFEMRCGDSRLVFDLGSGCAPCGKALVAEGVQKVHVLFTHCHYDHILGFPFFAPIYAPASEVQFWSGHLYGSMTTESMLEDFMRPPWFPVRPDICPASLSFRDFKPGSEISPEDGITVRTASLNHPGGAVGYRVEWNGKVVAVVTDTEHVPGADLDPAVMSLIRDADLFLYDASYLESEMAKFRGFGHSSWQQAVKLAKAANASRVALIHHAPWRTDDELDRIDAEARGEFPGAFVAADRQVVSV